MAHTKLPWRSKASTRDIVTAGGDPIIIASDVDLGDSLFITRACNSFDELLAACRIAIDYMEKTSSDPDRYHPQMMGPLRDAIAKAEGKE